MVTSFQPATLGKRSQVSPIPAADPCVTSRTLHQAKPTLPRSSSGPKGEVSSYSSLGSHVGWRRIVRRGAEPSAVSDESSAISPPIGD